MDKSEIHKTLAQLKTVTKYGMTGILVIMTLHCGLLYFGYDIIAIHMLFWMFVLFLGYKLSHVFGLCWVHKASVIYTMTVILCVAVRRSGYFPQDYLQPARLAMFFIGLIMIALNIWKALTSKNC